MMCLMISKAASVAAAEGTRERRVPKKARDEIGTKSGWTLQAAITTLLLTQMAAFARL